MLIKSDGTWEHTLVILEGLPDVPLDVIYLKYKEHWLDGKSLETRLTDVYGKFVSFSKKRFTIVLGDYKFKISTENGFPDRTICTCESFPNMNIKELCVCFDYSKRYIKAYFDFQIQEVFGIPEIKRVNIL